MFVYSVSYCVLCTNTEPSDRSQHDFHCCDKHFRSNGELHQSETSLQHLRIVGSEVLVLGNVNKTQLISYRLVLSLNGR